MTDDYACRPIRPGRRAISLGALVAVGVFGLFGFVTGPIPNPFYMRMVPRTPVEYLFLTLTALLAGGYATQRVSITVNDAGSELETGDKITGTGTTSDDATAGGTTGNVTARDDATESDRGAFVGLIGGFLAVGCPTCNAFLLVLFGSSTLMTYFDPYRPILGALSVAILAGLIVVRHRRTCRRCRR
ncbi:hypothetical protein ACLI4Q_18540 [Natrialbaceae archaeon A-CW1-1]